MSLDVTKYRLVRTFLAPLNLVCFNDVKEIGYNEQLKTQLPDIALFYWLILKLKLHFAYIFFH